MNAVVKSATAQLLSRCLHAGVKLSVDGGNLRVLPPAHGLDPRLLDEIRAGKAELMAALSLARATAAQKRSDVIPRKNPDIRPPLSFGQERIWLAQQLTQATSIFNLALIIDLEGNLDRNALQAAMAAVAARHSTLRTLIREDEQGRPYQNVLAQSDVTFEYLDLSADASHIDTLVADLHGRPFELDRHMPYRAYLLKRHSTSHVFLFVTHHISSDGWAIGILLRELAESYNAIVERRTARLNTLTIDYQDFSAWEKRVAADAVFDEGLRYWKKRLAGMPSLHGLPTDQPRAAVQSLATARYTSHIDPALLSELQAYSLTNSTTLFVVLMSALAVLIHRYSGENDVVIGTAIANRLREDVAPLIGLFVNMLPMRMSLDSEGEFVDLVRAAQADYLADIEHQAIPFQRLVAQTLGDSRSTSYAPLFQICFVLHNNDQAPIEWTGLECRTDYRTAESSQYDLHISADEDEQGMRIVWQYSTALFDAERIERMARHFQTLAREAITAKHARIAQLNLVDEAERAMLLRFANDTHRPYDPDVSFHHLFETQVKLDGDKMALCFRDQELSYAELNRRANKLAQFLVRERGAAPNQLIGVCLHRSPDLLISLLAIAKSGAAYVPLDPKYPASRIAYMTAQAELSTILTNAAALPYLGDCATHAVVLDDERWQSSIARQHDSNPSVSAAHRGENLAYVLYTSGSTGRPKGVMIEHRGLINFLMQMLTEPGIDVTDVLLAVSSNSFDIHTVEILAPLMRGAKVVMADEDQYSDPQSLTELMVRHQVTIMQATPSTWVALLDSGWRATRRMKILSAGEALSEKVKDGLLEDPFLELWNVYGPTEITVYSSAKRVHDDITLGKPFANTRYYILDREMNPTPLGVFGELYIAGDGLARGYLKQPELTQEVFLTRIPGGIPEQRLYRTGDFASRSPNGEVIYGGRRDNQVKVNGFRIEIGEIVSALENLSAVAQAAVIVKRLSEQSAFLAAFIVLREGHAWPGAAFADLLRDRLPAYMIPKVFQQLDRLPTNPNKKIDLKALAALDVATVLAEREERSLPQTAVEKRIASTWAELLGLEAGSIALDDNLLERGVDSIHVLMFVGRLKKRGVVVRASDFYRSPTVRGLAAAARKDEAQGAEAVYSGPASLTADQGAALSEEHNLSGFYINFIFDVHGALNLDLLRATMRRLMIAHDELRATFHHSDEVWRKQIGADADCQVVFEESLRCAWDAGEVRQELRAVLQRSHGRMSLTQGPLTCAVVIRDVQGQEKLLFCVSHLIADGFASFILLEDLLETYRQLRAGETPTLRNTLSAQTWSQRYAELVNSEEFCGQLHFWESRPWHKCAPFPVDFVEGRQVSANVISTSKTFVVRFDRDISHAIYIGLNEQLGISARDFLLSVIAKVLMRWSRCDAVSMQVLDAGRKDLPEALGVDLSRTVAPFAMRRYAFFEWAESASDLQLLRSLQAQLQTLPYGGAGPAMLRFASTSESMVARASEIPEPEIWINYIGAVADTRLQDAHLDTDIRAEFSDAMQYIESVSNNPHAPRRRVLGLAIGVQRGEMELLWEYSSALHRAQTIRQLAHEVRDEANRLLHSVAVAHPKIMPSSVTMSADEPALDG